MTENLKKFLEAISKNDELAAKVSNMTKDELIALAEELGIDLAEDDFAQKSELDDDELDVVAGGGVCACPFVGGGVGNTNAEKSCFCTAGGGGEISDLAGGGCRCVCVLGGGGKAVDSVPYPEGYNE
ncbi:MAG: Nif11-like leader peptide family natural product precursor [Clostridiales bacterium]|nr:Nif11-like leader peptide family natural product precursor [Clostridiales bacterium]